MFAKAFERSTGCDLLGGYNEAQQHLCESYQYFDILETDLKVKRSTFQSALEDNKSIS